MISGSFEMSAEDGYIESTEIASVHRPFHSLLCKNKKLSYCWETVRRESMPRIAETDVEMTI